MASVCPVPSGNDYNGYATLEPLTEGALQDIGQPSQRAWRHPQEMRAIENLEGRWLGPAWPARSL